MIEPPRRMNLIEHAKESHTWPLLREGVRILVLDEGADGSGRIALLRYEPGASVPRHIHRGRETIYVLEGIQEDETGAHGAGTWLANPPGTHHSIRSPQGCLVLIHWSLPVEFI
ncbi:MAG: cupin domain-containing protein [Fibrobacterota bacterium]|nr:MAG: cupin domain-containing protein [Fibrobacterota bacterium]